jgi:iron complex outermembrane receptor protein
MFAILTIAGLAQQPDPAKTSGPTETAPPKITTTETVLVTAPGEFRVEQTLDQTGLIEEAPGTSPIKSLEMLPSVNFQAADPYGSYEWAVRISVRGFNQNQLGFTLDEIPLGDMSYGNWNGLHISRAIIDENIGHVILSQGTGSLETASTSNLGGTIQFYSADPSDKRAFKIDQSFGSFNAYRTVARYESGLLNGNTKFYLSGALQLNDKWRGQGQIGQNYWQLNGKLVHYVGNSGVLSLFADYSDRREVDYQDVNKVWTQKLGYNWDNFGVWSTSIQAANACDGIGAYPGKVATLTSSQDPCDAGYYGGAGLRKDVLGGISYKQAINAHLTWKTTAYGHHNDGRGLWFTPYLATYDNFFAPTKVISPISLRTSEYAITRGGILSSLAYESGRNKVEGGVWFEGERWNLARRFYGTTLASPTHSLYDFPSNPFYTQWEYVFNSIVYQLHLQDEYRIGQKLSISAGFKAVETNTDGELSNTFTSSPAFVPGKYAQGALESGKPFLPQFGANYKIDGHNEIFGDASYNVRSYVPGGYGYGTSPWGTTQDGFAVLKSTLHPETSWSEEFGFRSTTSKASIQASYFHVNFSNRLLAVAQGAGIAGNASILSNVGGVTTNGVDGAVTFRLGSDFTLYNGATWNSSTYDSDVKTSSGALLYATQGKVVVDTPKEMWKNSLDWHKKGAFAHIGSDYMSTRYFTYSNDGSVDGRFLTEAGAGYTRESLGIFQDLKLQLNVYNLMGERYYSSIGTNGFIYSDPQSINDNTLQVGSPRTVVGKLEARF